MFGINGTRWVQAGSHMHRTVSMQALLINGEVFDFVVGVLVPCTTTSPSLGLTKYASAREICCPRWQATRGGRREMRDIHFPFFLCLANECLSFIISCFSCVSCVVRRFSPALMYFVHPITPEKVCSRSLDCGQWRETPLSPPHLC